MLVHLASDGSTTMLSFPRDTYVTIPAYTDKNGMHPEHKNKFNSAISDGGPSLADPDRREPRQHPDQPLRLRGPGGVQVDDGRDRRRRRLHQAVHPPRAERGDQLADLDQHQRPGQRVPRRSGRRAPQREQGLAFVRQRHGLLNGDLGRIQRQQQFLGAVFRKALTGGVLANPVKLEGLLSTATSAITLGSNTSLTDLRKLATRLRGVSTGQIKMETVPVHAPTRAEGAIDDMGDLPGVGSVQILEKTKLDGIVQRWAALSPV